MSSQLQSILVTCLIGLATAVFGPLLALVTKKLHDLIDAKVKNEKVRGILDRLDDTAATVVQSVEQQVVSKLDPTKPLADNGKAARDAAIAELKTHLGQKGLDEAKTILGISTDNALDQIIVSYIESHVLQVNQAQAAAAGGAK